MSVEDLEFHAAPTGGCERVIPPHQGILSREGPVFLASVQRHAAIRHDEFPGDGHELHPQRAAFHLHAVPEDSGGRRNPPLVFVAYLFLGGASAPLEKVKLTR